MGKTYVNNFIILELSVPPNITQTILEELHEGVCGGYPGSRPLSKKVINQGYYWMTLQKDEGRYGKRCEVCQKFGKISWQPSVPQTLMLTAWPFDISGIDLMEKFSRSRWGSEYLIVVVDYFSKCIEAKPLASPTEENTLNFLHDFVLCRYEIPWVIITDHDTQFATKLVAECSRLRIKHWKLSVAHP